MTHPYSAQFRCIAGCEARYALSDILFRCPGCGDLLEVEHDMLDGRVGADGAIAQAWVLPLDGGESERGSDAEGPHLDRVGLGLVGDPDKFEAILHVDEDDVELVQAGQTVAVRLDHLPGETFRGRVVDVARDGLPRHLIPRYSATSEPRCGPVCGAWWCRSNCRE